MPSEQSVCSRFLTDSKNSNDMKRLTYIIMVMVGTLLTSCMGSDYAGPDLDQKGTPWGNNSLTESNVITVAQLKNAYQAAISGNGYKEITDDQQLKVIVTGNDIQGNLYQQIAVQDKTGALIVGIGATGLHGYLPVGQEILINLKGLIIGGYGQQAQLGGIYTNATTGAQSVGRMNRFTWQEHFKLIGEADASKAQSLAEEFDLSRIADTKYLESNAGKLMTIKKVAFVGADGKVVYAPKSQKDKAGSVNRQLKDLSSDTNISTGNLVVRTSTFANFANEIVTKDTINLTGIFTRYRNTWQVLVRSTADIEKTVLAYFSETFAKGKGKFTINNVKLSGGLNQVWSHATYNGISYMKAGSYASGKNNDAESWLISPVIDLSKIKKATLSFKQVINAYFRKLEDEATVCIKTEKGKWESLKIGYPAKPEKGFTTFSTPGATQRIDITKYAGNKIQVAFIYKGSSTAAGTWEIKDFNIE